MADYLANQIKEGNLTYSAVIAKKPSLKSDIDAWLSAHGASNLITE